MNELTAPALRLGIEPRQRPATNGRDLASIDRPGRTADTDRSSVLRREAADALAARTRPRLVPGPLTSHVEPPTRPDLFMAVSRGRSSAASSNWPSLLRAPSVREPDWPGLERRLRRERRLADEQRRV